MDEVALNFRWLIPFRLAGMKNPARTASTADAIAYVKANLAIATLVTLHDRGKADEQELMAANPGKLMNQRWYHFEFPANGVPEAGVTALIDIAETLHLELRAGRNVAVHSGAGIGRVGTALAAYLIWAQKDHPMPDLLERSVQAVTDIGKAPQGAAQRALLKEFHAKVTG